MSKYANSARTNGCLDPPGCGGSSHLAGRVIPMTVLPHRSGLWRTTYPPPALGPCRRSRNRILGDPISRNADMDSVGSDPDSGLYGLCSAKYPFRVEKGPDAV